MDIQKILSEMTLEEKAGLCSGADYWSLKALERLGVPAIATANGPCGLAKKLKPALYGAGDICAAVCFPPSAALAASFDRELAEEIGAAIGDACREQDVAVLLGPAVNIKRSPLGGRNFEYYSEDPYLAGEIAAHFIAGVQSRGVGASLKHFAANNQECRRMTVSARIDERALREIYLTPFERAVRQSAPWTVMCAYNRINGEYASESQKLLTDILRGEWGFDGVVVSDWGAVNDRVKGLAAGLDLEMPSSGGENDARLVRAVREGTLSEEALDRAAARILTLIARCTEDLPRAVPVDWARQNELARRACAESMVLLKNDASILPLTPGEGVAFIGEFARAPRYQGGGCAHVNANQTISALEAVADVCPIAFAQGYSVQGGAAKADPALLADAVRTAAAARAAVLFVGLTDDCESEDFDRAALSLPACQDELIRAVCAVQPNTVIVLHSGSPVEMPWAGDVKAVLETYMGGQNVGAATVDILFGRANPCGKLAETFPLRLSDTPSYLSFPGDRDEVVYGESIFVGYRYYDTKKADVLFPFGHGLSYTAFSYGDLRVTGSPWDANGVTVSLDVTNTGARAGKEIVQLYVRHAGAGAMTPEKELRNFCKLSLEPGQTKRVQMALDARSFAYYDVALRGWRVEGGAYTILAGRSSRDIALQKTITVPAGVYAEPPVTMNTTLGELARRAPLRDVAREMLSKYLFCSSGGCAAPADAIDRLDPMTENLPLRGMVSFTDGKITLDEVTAWIDRINRRA